MLTNHESQRLTAGLRDTGDYFDRTFHTAKHAFLSGHSLDEAIHIARTKYGF